SRFPKRPSASPSPKLSSPSRRRSHDTLIDQCSRHDIPPVVSISLPAEGGTISPLGSRPWDSECSPLGGSDDLPIIGECPVLLGTIWGEGPDRAYAMRPVS